MIAGTLKHQWKLILTLVIAGTLAATAYTWFKTPEYLSSTTALPSSVYANDRSRLFNENIQILYSDLGSPDELDVITGSGQLDTVYLSVTDQFNLFDHYHCSQPDAREKAAEKLKSKARVIKTGNGELKVSVWDTDKNLAPQLANAIMDQLQRIHSDARNAGNDHMVRQLRAILDSSRNKKNLSADSIQAQNQKIAAIQTLLSEYETISAAKSPALVLIEKARPALRADRPKCLPIILATGILSFLLSFLLAVYRERTKTA